MPIFDQGYQHWNGQLSGHAWRWLAITRHGVKVGFKNRLLRAALFFAWTPALSLAVFLCVWGLLERKSAIIQPLLQSLMFLGRAIVTDPKAYRLEIWTICYDYFLLTELRFSMILILLVGPNLISQDLRFNALPLYFSRPLRRIDYFLGKLGVIAVFLALVVVLPSIIAYVLGLAFSLDITIIRDTFRLLLSCILYGLIITASAGLLVLALSSISRNSRYISLFWLGIWFVSSILGGILQEVSHSQRQRAYFNATSQRVPFTQGQRAEWERAQRRIWENFQAQELEAARTDWRPLVSYTANLQRIGQQLLGTNACWERLGKLRPSDERGRFLMDYMGSQYPWFWSAGVLLALFGLSAWILNFQVKSLDRLK